MKGDGVGGGRGAHTNVIPRGTFFLKPALSAV